MREFEFMSVDWDSVRLMQAGQFKQETWYLEELTRWALARGRISGLLHLSDGGVSRPSPEGDQTYSLTVRGCIAVGRLGHRIEIEDSPAAAVRGTIEARQTIVPLFVGVARLARTHEPQLHSSVDTSLVGSAGRRPLYALAADSGDDAFDWLQIAQFERTPGGLEIDRAFIPESMFLSSHAAQWRAWAELGRLTGQCLDVLVKNSSASVPRWAAACALASSVGIAARAGEARTYPREYVAQMLGVLASQRAQLMTLPSPNLKLYQDTLDLLDETLGCFDEADWTMAQAFFRLRECWERLLTLYPPLLASLEAAVPVPERRTLDHETVVPAPPPRPNDDEDPRPDPPRRGNFMSRK